MINRDRFFADGELLRLFRGDFSTGQAAGVNAIFDEWEKRALNDKRHLAYMLATPFHETGRKMQPIDELGGHDYFTRLYDVLGDYPDRARANGNVNVGDGARYHGRGLPQLTWRNNYRKMGQLLGVDLEGDPELAKVPDIAIKIMFEGMIRGLYTGRALKDYFSASVDDPVNARRIVNGLDKAEQIAGYHRAFLAALR